MDANAARRIQDAVQLFASTVESIQREAHNALEQRRSVVDEESRRCQRALDILYSNREKVARALQAGASSVVALNVGGSLFETTTRTLLAVPNSMLAMLVAHNRELRLSNCASSLHTGCDEEGRIFIDRSPAVFPLVLDYLRLLVCDQDHLYESTVLGGVSSSSLARLAADADYYGLQGLAERVEHWSMRRWIERSPRFSEVACDRSHKDLVLCLLLDAASSLVFVGSADSTVSAVQVPSLQHTLRFVAHGGSYVTCMAIHRSAVRSRRNVTPATYLLTGSRDGTIAVWHIPQLDDMCERNRHENAAAGGSQTTTCEFSTALVCRITAGDACFVQDLKLCDCGLATDSSGSPPSALIMNHGLVLVSAHSDGSIKTWTMNDSDPLSFSICPSPTGALRLAATVREIAVHGSTLYAATGAMVQAIDVKSMGIADTLLVHSSPIRCLAACPESRRLCAGSWDGKLLMWDLTRHSDDADPYRNKAQPQFPGVGGRLRFLGELHGCPDWVAHVSIQAPYVVASSKDLVLFFDMETSLLLRTISTGHSDTLRCFVLDREREAVVTGGFDATVRVMSSAAGDVAGRHHLEASSLQGAHCPHCGRSLEPPDVAAA